MRSSQPAPASQNVQEMAPPEPPRPIRARRGARPKFTGFEDDFSVPVSSAAESMAVDEPVVESQSLFVSQNTEVDMDREPSQPPETQSRTSRKRPASPIIEEEEQDILETMAPTTAALKRRRLARGEPTPPPPAPAPVIKEKPAPAKPAKKVKKEVDVLEIVRQKREAEEKAKAEREKMQEQLQSMDIEEPPEIQVVEMEVKRSVPPPRTTARADESERWDDRWNGRNNFKRFRRRGGVPGPLPDKLLVPLEVVKKKDFGIGDDYWEDGDSQQRKKKEKGKGRDTQEISQRLMEIQGRPSNKSQSRAADKASRILASEAEDELGAGDAWKGELSSDSDLEIVAPPPPKRVAASTTRSQRSQTQTLVDKTNETQNLDLPGKSGSGSSKGSKRPAEKVLTKPAPVKKARQMALTKLVEDSDDSDDDDGLKFRFKKR